MSLGTGALQVGRGPEHFRHSKEVSKATLRAGTTPTCNRRLAPSHWQGVQWKHTYLTLYLPKPVNHEGGRAGSKNLQWFTAKYAKEYLSAARDLQRSAQKHNWSAKISWNVTWNACKPRGKVQGVTLQVTYANGGNRWLHWLEINFA